MLRLRDEAGERWSEAAPLTGWSRDTLQDNMAALHLLAGVSLAQAMQRPLPPALSTALGLLSIPSTTGHAELAMNTLLLNGDVINEQRLASSCIKMKVGQQPIEHDIQRITAVLQQLPQTATLRLDANQSWGYADVQQLNIAFQHERRIDYIEEPLQPNLSYQHWSRISRIDFAHDERLAATEFQPSVNCSAMVIKPTLLGWQRTLVCHDWASKHHKPMVLSSSFESLIGLNLLKNLARYWQLTTIHGLATDHFFDNPLQRTGDLPLANVTNIERLL